MELVREWLMDSNVPALQITLELFAIPQLPWILALPRIIHVGWDFAKAREQAFLAFAQNLPWECIANMKINALPKIHAKTRQHAFQI